jgi:hypothetical protein
VESESPLSPPAPLPLGSPLIGSWRLQDKDETVYLHIGNDGQDVKLVEVELDATGRLKSETYTASATMIGANDYLSVRTPRDGRTLYALIRYRLNDKDTLTFSHADYTFLKNAVKSRLIPGTVDRSTPGVLLSADQETLRRFVADHDKRMFPEASSEFRRLP